MCGFVTIVTAPGQRISGAVLRRMTDVLVHRGPDGVGYACVDPTTRTARSWAGDIDGDASLSGVLFGHRRLRIVDKTDGGVQPMRSDDGLSVLCFNGEIYNFVELRSQLCSAGVHFRGASDTEVLLKAYEYWGEAALQRLNGMWAFALWDGRQQRLVLCRDRLGIKPLYYTQVDGAWVFASEIKAIVLYAGAFRGFDERGIMDFVVECSIDHRDSTLFRQIRQLPPASMAVLEPAALVLRRFWHIEAKCGQSARTPGEQVEQFRSLLTDAVRLRARAEVPVGTIMSGGIDSSSVTALAAAQTADERAGQRTFPTFSACWPGWEQDEECEVELLATALGVRSHRVYPTAITVGQLLDRVAYYLEEPFENPTAALQYLLMDEARRHGVRVILSGHGSDEVLGGYPDFFVRPFLADLLSRGHIFAYAREHRAFKSQASPNFGPLVTSARLVLGLLPAAVHWPLSRVRAIYRLKDLGIAGSSTTLWPRQRKRQACPTWEPVSLGPDLRHGLPPGSSRLDQALWHAITRGILPAWNRMDDRMSMACSVETRAPFLDHRIVEFAFGLAGDMKLKDGLTKYVLRQAMQGRLPHAIVSSRKKRKFATPYLDWLRGPWHAMVNDLLDSSCHVSAYIDMSKFRGQAQAYMAGKRPPLHGRVLWRVITTEIFLRTFGTHTQSMFRDDNPRPVAWRSPVS